MTDRPTTPRAIDYAAPMPPTLDYAPPKPALLADQRYSKLVIVSASMVLFHLLIALLPLFARLPRGLEEPWMWFVAAAPLLNFGLCSVAYSRTANHIYLRGETLASIALSVASILCFLDCILMWMTMIVNGI